MRQSKEWVKPKTCEGVGSRLCDSKGSRTRSSTVYKIKAWALYIINFVEIAYHSLGEWHIIIAKEIQPTVDEMHLRWWYTPNGDDMPLLSQWIKKYCRKVSFSAVFFWWNRRELNPCPKTSWYNLLRGQSYLLEIPFVSADRQAMTPVALWCLTDARANSLFRCTTKFDARPES